MSAQADWIGGGARKLSNGYAGTPGLGPDDETCKSCTYKRLQGGTSGRYWKCGIGNVTRGPGTDILMRTAACEFWEAT